MNPALKLVSAISVGNKAATAQAFATAIAAKKETALDVEKIRLTSSVYNGAASK